MVDRMPRPAPRSSPAAVRPDGFSGQRIVVLPPSVARTALARPLFAGLLPTDIGWYPAARGHRRERPAGSAETIFIHCLAGSGWCELEARRHTVSQGDLLVLPPGLAHAYGADARQPWSIRWFHLAGTDLPALSEELGFDPGHPLRPLADDATLALLFDDALSTLELGYAGTHLLRASRALAHYLAHAAWLARPAPPPPPQARVPHPPSIE